MNGASQHKRAAEPDRELVELAIDEVLQLANQQGITLAESKCWIAVYGCLIS